MSFYTAAQQAAQDQFESRALADRMRAAIVRDAIDEASRQFIEAKDFFFLSTVNGRGEPTVSYKGGPVGLVTVLDPTTIIFPIYDGNGMFLSVGNISETAEIGLLFIDFETPNRVRVQATAAVNRDDPEMGRYPGAIAIVRAEVKATFVNCARLIHKHVRVGTSPYVPDDEGATPLPSWKRIDAMQDVLPEADRQRVDEHGGVIGADVYATKLASGDS